MTNEQRLPAELGSSNDPDVKRLKVQLLALSEGLMNEGEPRHRVVYALADAIIDLIGEEYMKGNEEFLWVWHFLRDAEEGFGDWRRYLDLVEDMAEQIRRNKEAGGTGNPIQ